MTEKVRGSTLQEKATQLWKKVRNISSRLTLEPAMLIDGLSYSIMIVAVENIQMDKICLINLNYTEAVCGNLSAYPEASLEHQKAFSVFGMWYGVLTAILPLFFVLFVGAWSDKYGRKPPLIAANVGHTMWALCYLLNAYITKWPVEMLFLAAILDTMGGGTVSFLTACNAYISDVTKESERTSRVGLANSIWFLGGPLGTLLGTYIYYYGGYLAVFGISSCFQVISFFYILNLPESRGPFSQFDKDGNRISKKAIKEDKEKNIERKKEMESNNTIRERNNNETVENETLHANNVTVRKMLRDLFDYHRIVDSFRSTFRKREGNARTFVLLLITCNLLRRLGRGAYMYLFTRRVLNWGPTDYGIWVSYKNFVSAIGSLVAVPVLSARVGLSDNILALIGALAATTDYLVYGLITSTAEFLIWIAPIGGLLVNSCVIAIRSMLSKFVPGEELGKVSAVMGALDGVMPMASFSLYTLVYKSSVHIFPGAQFFFGSGANLLCTFIFMFIIYYTKTKSYSIEDLNPEKPKKAVTLKGFRDLSDNKVLSDSSSSEVMDQHSRLVVGVLAEENFHIASTHQRRKAKLRPLNSYAGQTSLSIISSKLNSHFRLDKGMNPHLLTSQFLFKSSADTKTSLQNSFHHEENYCQHPPLTLSISAPVSLPTWPFNSIPELHQDARTGLDNSAFETESINSIPNQHQNTRTGLVKTDFETESINNIPNEHQNTRTGLVKTDFETESIERMV